MHQWLQEYTLDRPPTTTLILASTTECSCEIFSPISLIHCLFGFFVCFFKIILRLGASFSSLGNFGGDVSGVWKILAVLVLCIFSVSELKMKGSWQLILSKWDSLFLVLFLGPISCMAPQGDHVRQERPTVARKSLDKEPSPSQRGDREDGIISRQKSNKFLLLC